MKIINTTRGFKATIAFLSAVIAFVGSIMGIVLKEEGPSLFAFGVTITCLIMIVTLIAAILQLVTRDLKDNVKIRRMEFEEYEIREKAKQMAVDALESIKIKLK